MSETHKPRIDMETLYKQAAHIGTIEYAGSGEGELYEIKGIYPAFHMNHKMWISIVLDETISDDKIMKLIQCSFDLTK